MVAIRNLFMVALGLAAPIFAQLDLGGVTDALDVIVDDAQTVTDAVDDLNIVNAVLPADISPVGEAVDGIGQVVGDLDILGAQLDITPVLAPVDQIIAGDAMADTGDAQMEWLRAIIAKKHLFHFIPFLKHHFLDALRAFRASWINMGDSMIDTLPVVGSDVGDVVDEVVDVADEAIDVVDGIL